MNTVIIVGSSATYGNTEQLALDVASKTSATVFNLSLYDIEQFDYNFNNCHDDFFNLIKKVLSFDKIILASPMCGSSQIMRTASHDEKIFVLVNDPIRSAKIR